MDTLCKYSSEKKSLKINLLEKKVFYNNLFMDFNISDDTRDRLLNGYDDIELTLKKSNLIDLHENQNYNKEAWKLVNNESKN